MISVSKLFKSIFWRSELRDVYTPNSAAGISYISREELEMNVESNLTMIGRPIILYGHSGGGKTTMIRNLFVKLKLIPIVTPCETSSTFETVLLSAFDELNSYYISGIKHTDKRSLSSELKSNFNALSGTLKTECSSSIEKQHNRILPPQLTPQRLAQLLGAIRGVWIIEDFHKVPENEKKRIADVIKIFIDISNDYPDVKIICIGAVDSPRKLLQQDANLESRVSDVQVPLLTDAEIEGLIQKGCKALNIRMEQSLIDKIVFYSGNLASVAHKMCYDICFRNGIRKTCILTRTIKDSKFALAVKAYLTDNSSRFKAIYDMSTSDPIGWYIIKTLHIKRVELSYRQIVNGVNKDGRRYKDSDINHKLSQLISNEFGVLRYNPLSHKYCIASPFWDAFLKMKLELEQSVKRKSYTNNANPNIHFESQDTRDAVVYRNMLDLLDLYSKLSSGESKMKPEFEQQGDN